MPRLRELACPVALADFARPAGMTVLRVLEASVQSLPRLHLPIPMTPEKF